TQSVAPEFLVNDKTEFAQLAYAITPLPEGGFAVGWIDVQSLPQPNPDGGGTILPVSDQVRGRVFDPAGEPVASSVVLSGQEPSSDTRFLDLEGIVLMNGDVAFGWRTQFEDNFEELTRSFSPELVPISDVVRPH